MLLLMLERKILNLWLVLHVDLFRINSDSANISMVPPPIPVPLTIPEIKPVNIFNIILPISIV